MIEHWEIFVRVILAIGHYLFFAATCLAGVALAGFGVVSIGYLVRLGELEAEKEYRGEK